MKFNFGSWQIILVIMFVLVVGGSGGILADRILWPRGAPLVISKKEEIIINEGINAAEVISRAKNSLAALYLHEQEFGSPGLKIADHFSGLVVGSDGVIVTPAFANREGYLITVLVSGQPPLQAKVLASDQLTGTSFLKVEAKDLPVARQETSRKGRAGERFLALWIADSPQSPKLQPVVQSASAGPAPKIGEYYSFGELNAYLPIAGANLGEEIRGGIIVNRDASVVGFVTDFGGTRGILRSDELKKVIDNFFDDGRIVWPNLPITYQIFDAPLAEIFNLPRKYGILIRSAPRPFLANDFIYAVDDRELTPDEGFQDIVLSKRPGDKIKVKLIRSQQDMEVEYTLQ